MTCGEFGMIVCVIFAYQPLEMVGEKEERNN